MNEIIKKLDSYELMLNLLPGGFFCISLKFFCDLSIPVENWGEELLVFYFVGFIINRLGSLVVKPLLRKCGIIAEKDYSDYVKAEKADSKVQVLSEINNYFRTLLTAAILIPFVKILQIALLRNQDFDGIWKWGLLICLIAVMLFSYRKQNKFVCKRIELTCNEPENPNSV